MQSDDHEPELQWVEDLILFLIEFGFTLVVGIGTIFIQFILAIISWANHDDA